MSSYNANNNNNDDAPLPLSALRPWVSPTTFAWLSEEDAKEARWKEELESSTAFHAANLFDEEEGTLPPFARVQTWTSSPVNPDGMGGTFRGTSSSSSVVDESTYMKEEEEQQQHVVSIICILSESWHGYGDQIWAASRHLANLLADPEKCRRLLMTANDTRQQSSSSSFSSSHDNNNNHNNHHHHPLLGLRVVELGAGAGVPSWTAMRCGARVVCTDQAVPNRIRCMAECAERNWRDMKKQKHNDNGVKKDNDDVVMTHAASARVCPYDWGKSVEEVVLGLVQQQQQQHPDGSCNPNQQEQEKKETRPFSFDVVVAADCCYMPWLHSQLLDSIDMLLVPSKEQQHGVAVLTFALHGNTDDEDVWGIVDRARDRGFEVDVLEPQQLTPQTAVMDSKQALVHTLRLRRKKEESK